MERMDFITGASFLIGGLSVLVMFLLGWQISTILSLKKEIKKDVELSIKELESRVDDKINDYESSIQDVQNDVISLVFFTMGKDAFAHGRPLEAIDYLGRSLIALNQTRNISENGIDLVLSYIEEVLPVVNKIKINPDSLKWDIDSTDDYIAEISKIKNDRLKPFLDFLYIVRVMLIGTA